MLNNFCLKLLQKWRMRYKQKYDELRGGSLLITHHFNCFSSFPNDQSTLVRGYRDLKRLLSPITHTPHSTSNQPWRTQIKIAPKSSSLRSWNNFVQHVTTDPGKSKGNYFNGFGVYVRIQQFLLSKSQKKNSKSELQKVYKSTAFVRGYMQVCKSLNL